MPPVGVPWGGAVPGLLREVNAQPPKRCPLCAERWWFVRLRRCLCGSSGEAYLPCVGEVSERCVNALLCVRACQQVRLYLKRAGLVWGSVLRIGEARVSLAAFWLRLKILTI